jgi:sulfotransferase
MKKDIHFISGLPRSGSTLLCNILAQNPEIHSTPTSACHDLLFMIRNNWNEWIEHKAAETLRDKKSEQNVLNAALYAYHNTDRPIVLDKGRGWISMIELAEFALGRKAKLIVPVRDITQILSSFEKLHRKNAHIRNSTGDFHKAQTVEGRCQNLVVDNAVFGLAYNRLKDALAKGQDDRLLFVEFEDLTFNPKATLDRVYDFLELKPYAHDFNNVEQYTTEDDFIHGYPDLHKIRRKVEPIKDDSAQILGASLVKEFTGTEIWRK